MGTRKNRLTEAVLTCTHDLCFEQNLENITIFHLKINIVFTAMKYYSELHRHVIVMDAEVAVGPKCLNIHMFITLTTKWSR